MTRILVLGATGMLGNAAFHVFSANAGMEVWGTLRQRQGLRHFRDDQRARLLTGIDVLEHDPLVDAMRRVRPDVVVNCVGVVKQLASSKDPLIVIPTNALLPHRLARICELAHARLIHISTDCVFSGNKGNYRESDPPDTIDLYGQSKLIGEVRDQEHVLTIRSSIIGHELESRNGLIEWFLAQKRTVPGYANAIFSGLPAVELARVIRDIVLPHRELNGLYHVSAAPIAKQKLLHLVAEIYGKEIDITRDDSVVIDRSLNADRFFAATGYVAPEWPELIRAMQVSRSNLQGT